MAIDVSWRLDTVADVSSLAQRADDGDGTRVNKRFQRINRGAVWGLRHG